MYYLTPNPLRMCMISAMGCTGTDIYMHSKGYFFLLIYGIITSDVTIKKVHNKINKLTVNAFILRAIYFII